MAKNSTYAYLRASTAYQSTSFPKQYDTISNYCTRNKIEIRHEEIYMEVITNNTPIDQRDKLYKLLMTIKEGDTILITELSRITRVSNILLDDFIQKRIKPKNINLIVIKENEMDALENIEIVKAISYKDQEFHDRISKSVIHAAYEKVYKGENYSGNPPFGYENIEGRLYPHEQHFKTLKKVIELHKNGISNHRISQELNKRNIPNTRGRTKAWDATTIKGIVATYLKNNKANSELFNIDSDQININIHSMVEEDAPIHTQSNPITDKLEYISTQQENLSKYQSNSIKNIDEKYKEINSKLDKILSEKKNKDEIDNNPSELVLSARQYQTQINNKMKKLDEVITIFISYYELTKTINFMTKFNMLELTEYANIITDATGYYYRTCKRFKKEIEELNLTIA